MLRPRQFWLSGLGGLCLSLLWLGGARCCAGGDTSIGEPIRPNLIYILLDDAGYGDLSCYGQERFETPNIDALARSGMRFTQHYAGCTVCAPTRCVLMTGRHTGHCFIRGNREVKPEGQQAIPDEIVTLPELLQRGGYATGAFGKWGLGAPGSEGDPTRQGFDVFYGYNCQREAHSYYPDHLWSNTDRIELDGQTYSHDLIMEQALQFIRDQRQGPFFCYLPVTIPHAAMHVPPSYSDPFREKFPQFEDRVGKYRGPEVTNPIAAFAGMMTKLDEDVGRLVDLLSELGIEEKTLIVLSSDNGPHHEGGHDPEFFDSNGPFRGHKRDLYEGGIRVPMIACWPGTIRPETTSDRISAHWDILPTFCELAGVEVEPRDGISLVPTLLESGASPEHPYLYWEFHEQGGKRAVRFGHWKAVQLGLNQRADGPVELFDLDQDPGETNDLADEHPDVVTIALRWMDEAHTPSSLWRFRTWNEKSRP